MKNSILIVLNTSHEQPGLIGQMLKEYRIPIRVIDLNAGNALPSPVGHDAMIVMGGPDSANDENQKMETELQRTREAIDAEIPYFGVCLGLQTLVKAAGGTVRRNDVREVAFRDQEGTYFTAEITPDGKRDPLMQGLPEVLPMFHLHGETVDLTPRMMLLASGKWCRNQIVRVAPKIYGMQGHLELTDEMLEEWCSKDTWLRDCNQDAIHRDWTERKEVLQSTLRTLFDNFLAIAGLL